MPLAPRRRTVLPAKNGQTSPLRCTQRSRARSRNARTAQCRHAWHHESRNARAAAASAAATGQQHAHARRTAHRTQHARPPRAAASSSAADRRLQTPRTNDDARRRKDAACPHGHKAGDAGRWGTSTLGRTPATGTPPCSSHASVAHTAKRSRHLITTRPRLRLAL